MCSRNTQNSALTPRFRIVTDFFVIGIAETPSPETACSRRSLKYKKLLIPGALEFLVPIVQETPHLRS